MLGEEQTNKNAFQWDAYSPLVGRIPACTAHGGGGVCTGGVGDLSAQGGVCTGGVWRGLSQHALRHTPPVDRQTPVKT